MLSIIIPVYNSERYLADCISSVLDQTYTDFELILVDDCSSDSSPAICDSFALKDSRVKVVHHTQNKGISDTRYDGYLLSKGEYISFVDNDDLLFRKAYELMMADIEGNDMSVVAAEVVDGDALGRRLSELENREVGPADLMSGLSAYELLKSGGCRFGDIGGPWGKVYTRELVDRTLALTLPYKESLPWSYFEDNLFIPICYPLAAKVVLHPFTGYLHRGGGLSCNNKPTPYLYGCIGAGNVVLGFYKEHSYARLYELYVGQHLVYLESIYYRIDRFEDDREKRERYIPMIEDAFVTYYADCMRTPSASASVKLSVFLFVRLRPLWRLLVGRLILSHKYPERIREGKKKTSL